MTDRFSKVFDEPDEVTLWMSTLLGPRATTRLGENGRLAMNVLELVPNDVLTLVREAVLRAALFKP
jgi:hypothetical protein